MGCNAVLWDKRHKINEIHFYFYRMGIIPGKGILKTLYFNNIYDIIQITGN